MPGNQAVKSTARAILKKHWPQLIVCTFLLLAGVFAGFYAQSVFILLMGELSAWAAVPFIIFYFLLFFSPLALGVLRYVWRMGGGSADGVETVFYYFSSAGDYLKSVSFTFFCGIKIILSAFLAYLPYIALVGAYSAASNFIGDQAEMHVMFLSTIFLVLGFILFLVFSTRYYIAPLLFVGGDRLEVAEVLHLSKIVSRYTAGAYIVLIIGMLGWVILSALGVTLVYTVPYILVAYTVHCRYAVYFYNHRAKINRETDFPEFRSSF